MTTITTPKLNLRHPPKPTPAEEAEVDALRTEVRTRPSYILASVLIKRMRFGETPTKFPTPIGRIRDALETYAGAKLNDETLIVAFEDAGMPIVRLVRNRDGTIDGEVSIDERLLFGIHDMRRHGDLPAPGRFRIWGDDEGSLQ